MDDTTLQAKKMNKPKGFAPELPEADNSKVKVIGKNERNIVKKGLLLYESEVKELLGVFLGKKIYEQNENEIDQVIDKFIEGKYYSEEYLEGNMIYDDKKIDNIIIKDIDQNALNIIKINLKIVNKILDDKEYKIEAEETVILTVERIKNKYLKVFEEYYKAMEDENFIYCENILNDKLINSYVKCSATFNKIYSEYAIEMSAKKKVIAEKIDEIKLRMLSMKIFDNMIKKENTNYKYILFFNQSIYKKVKKLNSLFRLMDDPYSQSKILLAIDYKTLIKEKEHILKYRQNGYRFIVEVKDENFIKIDKDALLYCEYIFVNTDNTDITDYYNYIPVNMIDKLYLTKQTILYEEMF